MGFCLLGWMVFGPHPEVFKCYAWLCPHKSHLDSLEDQSYARDVRDHTRVSPGLASIQDKRPTTMVLLQTIGTFVLSVLFSFAFGTTLKGVYGLCMVLCSDIIPARSWDIKAARNQTWISYVQSKCTTHCIIIMALPFISFSICKVNIY